MSRRAKDRPYAPVFIVLAVLAVSLLFTLLPSSVFGTEWASVSASLWTYMPWVIGFAVALAVLFTVIGRGR